MATITYSPDGFKINVAVAAGETTSPITDVNRLDTVVNAIPGSGGTMLVEASWSLPAAVAGGTANWFPWDAGTVSTKTTQLLSLATAVRFTATTAAGVGELAR